MSFDYEVKLEGTQALRTAEEIERAAGRVEKKLEAAGDAGAQIGTKLRDSQGRFLATAQAADQLAKAIGNGASMQDVANSSLERSAQLQDRIRSQAQGLSLGFDKIAEAMRREQETLERINGPMKRYEADLQALDSLHNRGALSTSQYVAEVRRLNDALDRKTRVKDPKSDPKPVDQAAIRAAATDQNKLVAGLGLAGLGFEQVAKAIQLEQQMLDKIRGPLRQYQEDMTVLNTLHTRGVISTKEYTDQVRALQDQVRRGGGVQVQAPAAVQKSPGLMSKVGDGLGGALTVAAGNLIAGVTAGAATGALELANAYQQLNNRLKTVAGTGGSVTEMFNQVRSVSISTRSSMMETTEAFVRMRGATKELGLTNAEVFQLTERVNKAIVLSGASASESAAGLQQFGQALASGRLQGDEFRSIMENLPYFAEVLSTSLGVTRAKLREMSSEGKLTSAVLVDAFTKAGAKIDKDFGKTAPTLSQQWVLFKDQVMVAVGKFFESTKLFDRIGSAIGDIGTVLGSVGDAVKDVADLWQNFTKKLDDTPLSALIGKLDGVGKVLGYAGNGLKLVVDLGGKVKGVLNDVADALGIGDESREESARARGYIAEMEALKKLMAEQEKFAKIDATLKAARQAGVANVPAFNLDDANKFAELAQMHKSMFGINLVSPFEAANKEADKLATGIQKIKDQRAAKQVADDIERAANQMLGFNKSLDDNAKHWKSIEEKLKDVNGALDKYTQERAAMAAATGKDPAIQMHGKGAQDALDVTRHEIKLKREARDLTDELNNREYAYGDTVVRIRKATAERKDDVEGVNAAYRDGRITLTEYTRELKALGAEEDHATKMLKAIKAPAIEFQKDITALNLLLARGQITLTEYNNALRKTMDTFSGPEMRKLMESIGAMGPEQAKSRISLGNPISQLGFSPEKLLGAGDFMDVETLREQNNVLRERFEMLQKYQESVDKAGLDMEHLYSKPDAPSAERDLAAQEQAMASLEAMYQRIRGPEREYRMGLSDAKYLLDEGRISTSEYNVEVQRLADAFTKTQLKMNDDAKLLAEIMKDVLGSLEEAFVSLAMTGKFEWKKMVESILGDLTRLAVRALLFSAIGLIPGGGGFLRAAGMAWGGAHATGGSYVAGGQGGPDSQNVMFRLTPGERVDFTPPGGTRSSGGGSWQVHNHFDPRELLTALDSVDGDRVIHNFIRRNPGAVRGLLQG